MSEFKLTDPYGTAPSKPPFDQSVSTGVPWRNLPVTREYTLGQLLDQTIARCGENDAVVYADRDFRLTWFEFGEEVDLLDVTDDIQLAVAKIKELSEKRNVEINKMVLTGISAGGHLAASTGVLWKLPEVYESVEM